MSTAPTDQLFMLAVDQRPWLTKALFGHTGAVTPAERALTTEAKHLVLDGLLAATDQSARGRAALLVDAELGPGVAERARYAGVRLAVPIERAGLDVYATEPDDLAGHLRHLAPEFAKVLVRYNPDGDPDQNLAQRNRLAEASQISRDSGCRFLFELLVPPTPAQLESVAGDQERYANELRPGLTRQAMAELLVDVGVDTWKLEHQGSAADHAATADLARSSGADCIVLGAGAPAEVVDTWLGNARAGGFNGFAIGRSIWWESVQQLADGRAAGSAREKAVAQVADRYRRFVTAFGIDRR
ncbi:MAG: 2-deoxy-5-keto-D-gluconate 6-phosphate aldolase domain-containing protein [Propionibacteriaceae bacterium]